MYNHRKERNRSSLIDSTQSIKYKDLNDQVVNPFTKRYTLQNESEELVYKCNTTEPGLPGGVQTVSQYVPSPIHTPLSWNICMEDLEGPDTFMEQILQQIREDKSFPSVGRPGVGKTFIYKGSNPQPQLKHSYTMFLCASYR